MKKRILKVLSIFLICFTIILTYTQEKNKVDVKAEAIALTVGTVYTVSQILISAGVITSESACTVALAKAFLTPDYVSTEQDMRIRAMTPTSCDTPGCIQEEDIKSAYKFKQDIKEGKIILPKTVAIQSFSAIGINSVVNTAKCSIADAKNLSMSETTNVHSVIRLHNLGYYRLTVNCRDGQSLPWIKTVVFENKDGNSAIRLYSQMLISTQNKFFLLFDFVNGSNELTEYMWSSDYMDTNLSRFGTDTKIMGLANSFTYQDTFDLNLEYLGEGLGFATCDSTVETDTVVNTVNNCIAPEQAQNICVRVPGDIANNWDTSATPDVLEGANKSSIESVDGDTWDIEKGWQSEIQGISGILGDILNAIKDIGRDVWDFFEEILNNILDKIDDVITSIKELTWADVISAITGLPTELLEVLGLEGLFAGVVDTILSIPISIYNLFDSILTNILSAINSLVGGIIEGIKSLFIPTLSLDDSINTLKSKFNLPSLQLPDINDRVPLTIDKEITVMSFSYHMAMTLDQPWYPILREILLGLFVLCIFLHYYKKTSDSFGGE